uniref:Retinol dehydrogenase 11-like n=1 Tax=Diabrotica virgifera virgifera TaxID=50390 RepID=A0A6P7H4N6_DIAVI
FAGAKVILACRNLEKAKAAVADIQKQCTVKSNLGELKVVELDLCSLESVRKCAKELLESEERINLLINNAGVMMCPYSKTKDGFETQFGTNHLAHFLFTLLLLPKICKSMPARIVNVSSIAHTELKVVELDLCSLESVRKCAKELLESEERINLLINNAGVMMCPYSKTKDGFETQFGTNHLAHFLFTLLLLPKICKSMPARIVNVSSIAHTAPFGPMDFTDLNFEKRKYNPVHAYQQSKLANILFTKELARRLTEKDITDVHVYSLHPGVIRTELGRHYDSMFPGLTWVYDNIFGLFIKTPTQGAQTQIYCAVDDNCASETGLYYAECAVTSCSREAENAETARKLWDISMELVGLDKNDDIFKIV